MNNYENFTISWNSTCLDGLKKLDQQGSKQTLFVIDDSQRLIGTVTDGDIRRGLIKGFTTETEIVKFCHTKYSFIKGEINFSEIRRLKRDNIKLLPKLDAEGRIVKVFDLARLKSILPVEALIMAGGKGERLRPLTEKIPKPMLPLGHKPILEHNIDLLVTFGIERITISVNYLSDQIINYFGDGSSKGISINYIEETKPLGTIGCVSLLGTIKHQALLVLNSDIFTNIDFEDLYQAFEDENADMVVASIPYSVNIPYAILELTDNRITSFNEKPKNTYYANAGIYIIKKDLISYIPKDTFFNATDLMDIVLSKKGKLIQNPITGFWIDIGMMDDYNKAKEIIKHTSNVL